MRKYPRIGVHKCVQEIEILLLKSRYLHGEFYRRWLELSNKDKIHVRNKIGGILTEYILKDLWYAIAEDILKGGIVHTELCVFTFINVHVFNRNTRKMLVFLQDVLEERECEKGIK